MAENLIQTDEKEFKRVLSKMYRGIYIENS